MKFEVQGEMLLVKPIKENEWKLIGSIAIPRQKDLPPMGEVIGMSKGLIDNMNPRYNVKVGDKIMYKAQIAVYAITVNKEELFLVHYSNVMGIISDLEKQEKVPSLAELKKKNLKKGAIVPN